MSDLFSSSDLIDTCQFAYIYAFVTSLLQYNLTDLQHENEKLKKQVEKQKNKHKMEMVTMKQYMAESKLPESTLRPIQYEKPLPTSSVFTGLNDDDAWKVEFGAIYQEQCY